MSPTEYDMREREREARVDPSAARLAAPKQDFPRAISSGGGFGPETANTAGQAGQGYRQPSLVERAYKALAAERQSQERADAARRVLLLHEKHPEVLELLDLLQQL